MQSPSVAYPCLYDTAALETVMRAMACEVAAWARTCPPLVVVGVLRRGAPLADHLSRLLVDEQGLAPPLRLDLSVKRYADDLTLLYPDTHLEESPQQADLDLSGRQLLVVDDVFYTGHSILKVVNHLVRRRPAEIRVATLVDRCVARLPLHANVVEVRLQIAAGGIVECHVPPYEPTFEIRWVSDAPAERTP